jgi:hypothetical protein
MEDRKVRQVLLQSTSGRLKGIKVKEGKYVGYILYSYMKREQ